ncbi:MAG: c-type cytochrome domain-containing protein [Verrucomicrobiota bacterium]
MTKRAVLVCLVAALSYSWPAVQGGEKNKSVTVDVSKLPPASDKQGVTYAGGIKAIFDESCIRCHGPEKPKARLRLDSLQGALKGSEDGKVIRPGNSAGSLLIHCVAHAGDPDVYMPPPKNKANIAPLTKEQIGLLRAWIDQGAK